MTDPAERLLDTLTRGKPDTINEMWSGAWVISVVKSAIPKIKAAERRAGAAEERERIRAAMPDSAIWHLRDISHCIAFMETVLAAGEADRE